MTVRGLRDQLPYGAKWGWHLSIKRNDREPIREWRDLQRIKNELCGPEAEAVELFPAESRLTDEANQFHLWVFNRGYRFPFGDQVRSVLTRAQAAEAGAEQREPEDLYYPPEGALERPPETEDDDA